MTSFAFILGVLPLVVASGAGAEMRRSLGTAVFSGMLGVTLFGIFLTPVFFYVILELERDAGCSLAVAAPAGSARRCWAALVGLAGGYLLARLGVVAAAVGAGGRRLAGVLAVLAVLGIHRDRPATPAFSRQRLPARRRRRQRRAQP